MVHLLWNRVHNELLTLQGHPRPLISAPIEIAYCTYKVSLDLSCCVSEILELLYTIYDTPPLFRPKFRNVPLE